MHHHDDSESNGETSRHNEPEDLIMTDDKSKNELLQKIADDTKEHYADLRCNWSDVERKAQGNVAICGIFLAAVLAYIRNTQAGAQGDAASVCEIEPWLISAAVVSLAASVALSLYVLLVRDVIPPPVASETRRLVTDVIEADGAANETMRTNLIHDTITTWDITNASMIAANDTKAIWLMRSQWALAIGVVAATIVTLKAIWA